MYGSFVSVGIITGLLLIVMKSARYKNATICSLAVDQLVVQDLKVQGKHDICFGDTHSDSPGSNNTKKLEEAIDEMKLQIEALWAENKLLKDKLENIRLADLADVDTENRIEDGAFIGWAESENAWVPYPEVGN